VTGNNSLATALTAVFGVDRVRRGVALSALTTFRVGGPADLLIETRSGDEIVTALGIAHQAGAPVTMLGGGSNVLVADRGIRGLVIRPRAGEIRRVDERHIEADAAVTINGLVRWTVSHRAAGLEAWAGTPGTVGGAVFGNAHFGGRLISEHISRVRLAARDGRAYDLPASEMQFGYDRSRLQQTGELLLAAEFEVGDGEPSLLRATARESLAFRKRTQPLDTPSAGCVFQNPEPARDRLPDGVPWSAGALVDRAGLKGQRVGGAVVSPAHGNFVVNDGTATAADIRSLIELCRRSVRDRFGVELREEIVYLGEFDVHTAD
jgi:UDP-N-acetylmuramate dehydrogenase